MKASDRVENVSAVEAVTDGSGRLIYSRVRRRFFIHRRTIYYCRLLLSLKTGRGRNSPSDRPYEPRGRLSRCEVGRACRSQVQIPRWMVSGRRRRTPASGKNVKCAVRARYFVFRWSSRRSLRSFCTYRCSTRARRTVHASSTRAVATGPHTTRPNTPVSEFTGIN